MNKLKYSFVKLYLWLCRKKLEKIKRVRFVDNKIREVIVFDGKRFFLLGQGFPLLNVILIHKSVLKYPKGIKEYILEHERAHSEMNWLLSLPLFILILCFGILAALSLIGFLSFGALALLKRGIFIQYAYFSILSFVSFVIYLLLFSLISWVFEIYADFNAINVLGLNNVKRIYKRLFRKTKRSIIKKILSRVTHPPRRLVLWMYKKIYK